MTTGCLEGCTIQTSSYPASTAFVTFETHVPHCPNVSTRPAGSANWDPFYSTRLDDVQVFVEQGPGTISAGSTLRTVTDLPFAPCTCATCPQHGKSSESVPVRESFACSNCRDTGTVGACGIKGCSGHLPEVPCPMCRVVK